MVNFSKDWRPKDFFKGWKRKLGILTLFAAGIVVLTWMRAQYIWDDLTIKIDDVVDFTIFSRTAYFECWLYYNRDLPSQQIHGDFGTLWDNGPALIGDAEIDDRQWNLDASAFRHSVDTFGPHVQHQAQIAYGLVALPLIALSAWLLLMKPRPATPPESPIATKNRGQTK